ncbi:12309_t:CDS:2, partial [Racocetra fulgida]
MENVTDDQIATRFYDHLKGQRSVPNHSKKFVTQSLLRIKQYVESNVKELDKERIFLVYFEDDDDGATYIALPLLIRNGHHYILSHDGLLSIRLLSIHAYELNELFLDTVGRKLNCSDKIVVVEKSNQIDGHNAALFHDGLNSEICLAELDKDDQILKKIELLPGGSSEDLNISSKLQTKIKMIDTAESEGIISHARAELFRAKLPYKPDFTTDEIKELKKNHTPITKVMLADHAPLINHPSTNVDTAEPAIHSAQTTKVPIHLPPVNPEYLNNYYLEKLKLAEKQEKFIPNLGFTEQFNDTKPFTAIPLERRTFDEQLYIKKVEENANKRLHKSLATLMNIADRADTHWPDNFADIFIKSQILKKLEKMWSSAKAGQTLASLHEFAIYMIGSIVRMVSYYVHSKIAEMKERIDSSNRRPGDRNLFILGTNDPVQMEKFVTITGDAEIYDYNTIGDIAYTFLNYIISDEMHEFALQGKPLIDKNFIFCGWLIKKAGILKIPRLIHARINIAIERKNLENVIASYAAESHFAFNKRAELWDLLD